MGNVSLAWLPTMRHTGSPALQMESGTCREDAVLPAMQPAGLPNTITPTKHSNSHGTLAAMTVPTLTASYGRSCLARSRLSGLARRGGGCPEATITNSFVAAFSWPAHTPAGS